MRAGVLKKAERLLGVGRADDGLCRCPGGARFAVKHSQWVAVRCPSGVGVCFVDYANDWDKDADEGRGGLRPGAVVYDECPAETPAVCEVCGRPKETVFIQYQSGAVWNERGSR